MTSPPSARPLVSRITRPTSGPIAFSVAGLTFSAAAGSASIAARRSRRARPSLDLAEALALDDRRPGSPPSATSFASTCRGRRWSRPSPRPSRPARRAPPGRPSSGGCPPRPRAARRQLAGDPVGDRLRGRRRRRPPARSSKNAPSSASKASWRPRGRQPELGGVALAARLGQLGQRSRAVASISSVGASGTRSGSGK